MTNNSDYFPDNLSFKSEDDSFLKNNPEITFSSNGKLYLDELSYLSNEQNSFFKKIEERNWEDISRKFAETENKNQNNLSDIEQYKDNKNISLNKFDNQKKIVEESAITSDKTKTNSNKFKKEKKSNKNILIEETKKENEYLRRKRKNNDNNLKKVRIMLLNL